MELPLFSLFLFFLFVSAFYCSGQKVRLFQISSFKLPSLNISVSSAVFPAALHGDSPKPQCTAMQLVGISFPLIHEGKSTCRKDAL